jgi:hypothetical protein
MEQKKPISLPRRSLYYILMCAGGILAFVFLGVLPAQRASRELQTEIASTRVRIEEQKVLFPQFQDLLQQERKIYETGLTLPLEKGSLPQDQVSGIAKILWEIAGRCNLEAVIVTPDLKSLGDGSRILTVGTVVRGEFGLFRNYLLELNRLPYLERINEMQVQETMGGLELRLKLLLALGD